MRQKHTCIEKIEATPERYGKFIECVRVASRRHIPRGCRTNYIPSVTEESKSLYEGYKKQYSRGDWRYTDGHDDKREK